MTKVIYENLSVLTFDEISVGNYFIKNGELCLKISNNEELNTYIFDRDTVVTNEKNATLIFKNSKDIKIFVNK